ncbi:hypothetical protein K439DRAFT_1624331 [Ramaria rubella]|nr:hypothetical protein K439DRAFT_1624331 [Ramaria rubella]
MASPKRCKKANMSIPSLEADLAVAQAKQGKVKKKPDTKKTGKKCSGSDASLGIPSSHAKKPKKTVTKKDGQGDSGDEASESEHGSEDEDLVEGVPGSPHLYEPLQSQTVCAGPSTAHTNPPKASTAPMSQPMKKTCQSLLDKALELVVSQNATITEVIKNNNRARKERKQMDSEIAIQMKKMQFTHKIVMLEKCMALEHKYMMECMECQKGAITPSSSVSSPATQGFTDFMSDFPLGLGSGTAVDHFPNVFADYSLT